jgi:hypothetical protein
LKNNLYNKNIAKLKYMDASKDSDNIFKELNIPVPSDVYSYEYNKQKEIYQYLSQVGKDEQYKKAYLIAFNHLGSSFNIYKSNGFKEWKEKQHSHSYSH